MEDKDMDEKANSSVDQLNQPFVAMKLKEDAIPSMDKRESFERFGDDLTEVIVSYLSTKDKFRFECLSKRIQSLIFNKHYSLKIMLTLEESEISFYLFYKQNDTFLLKLKNIEKCLRKLKYLKTIYIDSNFTIDSQLLKTIANICHYIKRLTIPWNKDISRSSVEYFGKKCGQRLEYLAIGNSRVKLYSELIRHLLSFTPKLISLKLESLDCQLLKHKSVFNIKSESLLTKLRDLECDEYEAKDMIKLQKRYCNQLVSIRAHRCVISDAKEAELLIASFGRYRRLQTLVLRIEFRLESADEEVYEICEMLTEIADNCLELLRLEISLEQISGKHNYLALLKTFKQLTELDITLKYDNSDEICVSFADWNQLTQLTVLSLNCNHLLDTDFANIGQILPQLESIVIKTEELMIDRFLDYISQLQRLKRIEIYSENEENEPTISESGVKQLLESCPQIRSFSFIDFNDRGLHMNAESIEGLKQLAKQMPKIDIKLEFIGINVDSYRDNLTKMPLNLQIKVIDFD